MGEDRATPLVPLPQRHVFNPLFALLAHIITHFTRNHRPSLDPQRMDGSLLPMIHLISTYAYVRSTLLLVVRVSWPICITLRHLMSPGVTSCHLGSTHTHTRTHTHTHTRIHAHTHTRTRIHAHAYTYTYTHRHTHTRTHTGAVPHSPRTHH